MKSVIIFIVVLFNIGFTQSNDDRARAIRFQHAQDSIRDASSRDSSLKNDDEDALSDYPITDAPPNKPEDIVRKKFNEFLIDNNINLYGGMIDIAVINKNKELNIIMREYPKEYYKNYQGRKSLGQITDLAGLNLFFKSAKIILNKFPEIVKYTIFTMELFDALDKYGNFERTEAYIVKTISMKKKTILKVNWEYVDRTLYQAINDGNDKKIDTIMNMCDIFSLKRVRFY